MSNFFVKDKPQLDLKQFIPVSFIIIIFWRDLQFVSDPFKVYWFRPPLKVKLSWQLHVVYVM
eukprot:UN06437